MSPAIVRPACGERRRARRWVVGAGAGRRGERCDGASGQASLLLVGLLACLLVGALLLGGVARGLDVRGGRQGAVDLAALAAARALRDAQPRVYLPAVVAGVPDPRHLERDAYLAIGRRVAVETARRNGATVVEVSFPDAEDALAPTRVAVTARDPLAVHAADRTVRVADAVRAVAELIPAAAPTPAGAPGEGEYPGPFAERQGERMRPDVAAAFDRMAAAARAEAGLELIVTSGFRTNAEQAALFARHPDPRMVARPGTSLHRLATELDLGPPAAYAWLLANGGRWHFKRRYAWEAWHFGFTLNAGSASLGDEPDRSAVLPAFVPPRFAAAIGRAAQRWNVSSALLAAQLWQESRFNPFAVSAAGAQGIAQFMPGTAAGLGLANPFDAEAAIDTQARLMRDLLREFGAVSLALAAYNAGPGAVSRCGCVPPYPETQRYVTEILGLLGGAGAAVGAVGGALEVRLVE